jgi:hypothetical protein
MQSAFIFENGKRVVFETTPTTITVYHCDEDWNKLKEFANFELTSPEEDYHFSLRKLYMPIYFVEQESTLLIK